MKRQYRSYFLAGLGLVLSLWALPAQAAEVLRVGGTGGATALLEQLGEPFRQKTGIRIEVIPSLGSGGGISAAADGVLDIAISGRPLSKAEKRGGLVQFAGMRTPYVLVTSRAAPPAMSVREIAAAFAADRATWPDGSVIKLILRPRAESDNAVLVSMFPGMSAALDAARKRRDLSVAATDQDNADMAERLPGSLTGGTYAQIVTEQRNLRMIAIDGVAPTLGTFESGAYRYGKVFYVIHRTPPTAAAARFVAFLRSPDGGRALRVAGCLPGIE